MRWMNLLPETDERKLLNKGREENLLGGYNSTEIQVCTPKSPKGIPAWGLQTRGDSCRNPAMPLLGTGTPGIPAHEFPFAGTGSLETSALPHVQELQLQPQGFALYLGKAPKMRPVMKLEGRNPWNTSPFLVF